MIPDADEVVIFEGSQSTGDTYLFEPTDKEVSLGWLYVAAEIDGLDGVGKDILDTTLQALQREYYRDASRGVLASFESALHQANLVLHDLAEQGVRDWMKFFNVAVGVLADTKEIDDTETGSEEGKPSMTLHVSTAGDAVVLLARSHKLSSVSAGLSHSPVTDPLRTFSSVASGVITERDMLFFGTSNFEQVYSNEDLVRFVVDQSAETIAIYLTQLYEDQKNVAPVAGIVVAMTSGEQIKQKGSKLGALPASRDPISVGSRLSPRKPLIISRSTGKRILWLIGRFLVYAWEKLLRVVWPFVKESSRKGGKVIVVASKSAGRGVQSLANKKSSSDDGMQREIYGDPLLNRPADFMSRLKSLPGWLIREIAHGTSLLPKSSKVFAVIAIVLAILLGASVVLLQKKRAADVQIQQASEFLHEARTKKEAAETALIYDNRDQARALLADAKLLAEKVSLTGLYEEQEASLSAEITIVLDRLDKVTRASEDITKELGDFATVIPGETPSNIFFLNGAIYSFDPKSNVVVRMNGDGSVEKTSKATQGIGFFTEGVTHEADKSIMLVTDEPGLAIYDAKSGIVQKQEIQMPSSETVVKSVATFGNRIYIFDQASGNIFGYSKTLRGFNGGTPWLASDSIPTDNIVDIGVDGYIYTLHNDGVVRKLLKGTEVDFKLEQIEPSIGAGGSLVVNEQLKHLYVFDPANKRVVIFDTVGNLTRQVFLGEESKAADIAVSTDETSLFVLDGTRVLEISLKE